MLFHCSQTHSSKDGCRLKRVVLIGDHHQLPPVVKNMAFQKYGHLDQSLFTRFVRLGELEPRLQPVTTPKTMRTRSKLLATLIAPQKRTCAQTFFTMSFRNADNRP